MARPKKRKVIFYKKKKFSNPFFNQPKKRSIKFPKFSSKIKIIIIAVMILMIVSTWFFFFSTVFKIEKIIVVGAQKIPETEIESLVWQQAARGLGLQKNIFLFSRQGLAKAIDENYFVDNLAINKNLPQTLTISFTEKTNAAIWLENEEYYYIDNSGNLIEQVDLLNIKEKSYPLIANQGDSKINGKSIDLASGKLTSILSLYEKIKARQYNFIIDRFIINNDNSMLDVKILNGPEVYFNIDDDLEKQLIKLDTIINEKLKDDFLHKQVIDLRYGDRIYYH